MKWANLQALWLLVPWVFLFPLRLWLEGRAREALDQVAKSASKLNLITGDPARIRRRKFALLWVAIGLAILAAARPQVGNREEEMKSQGLDVIFALDVSRSMATEDVVPSRLKKAKHLIRNFLERFSGDRAGVLIFAGTAFAAVPLTADYEYVRQVLDGVDENSIANQGTDIHGAVTMALRMIEQGGVDAGSDEDAPPSRALILLSDGEDHESASSLAARARKLGVRIFAIGVGTLKGAPIPVRDEQGHLKGYKKDPSTGQAVLSKLEEKALRQVAEAGGGLYAAATMTESEVDEIMGELLKLERSDGAVRRVVVYDEVFQYPLFLALAFALLSLFFAERGSVALVFLAGISFCPLIYAAEPTARAGSWREFTESSDGLKAYEGEDFAGAVNHFGGAQAERPESTLNHFNLGTALLRSGAAKDAVPSLQKGTEDPDAVLAGKSAYNLGRALQAESQTEKALDAYQKGLERLAETKKSGSFGKEAEELEKRLKQALEAAEAQRQQQKSSSEQQQGQGKDGQGQNESDKKNEKDSSGNDKNKDQQGEEKDKRYQIPREKQKYKAENLSEEDAKRLMQQLKEQEGQTSQRLRRKKSDEQRRERGQQGAGGKDW